MTYIVYRLKNGKMWDVDNACWINKLPNDSMINVIDLVSSDGVSDEAYLRKTLSFYGYPLGELNKKTTTK